MSVTSNRLIQIAFSSDIEYTQEFLATTNATGSGQNQLVELASGNNTITVPSGAIAVTIIPPVANTKVLTIKGVNGDTGISIHLVDPCSLSLNNVSSFVLNSSGIVTVRLIFS